MPEGRGVQRVGVCALARPLEPPLPWMPERERAVPRGACRLLTALHPPLCPRAGCRRRGEGAMPSAFDTCCTYFCTGLSIFGTAGLVSCGNTCLVSLGASFLSLSLSLHPPTHPLHVCDTRCYDHSYHYVGSCTVCTWLAECASHGPNQPRHCISLISPLPFACSRVGFHGVHPELRE